LKKNYRNPHELRARFAQITNLESDVWNKLVDILENNGVPVTDVTFDS
jgi:hypothetical protein